MKCIVITKIVADSIERHRNEKKLLGLTAGICNKGWMKSAANALYIIMDVSRLETSPNSKNVQSFVEILKISWFI